MSLRNREGDHFYDVNNPSGRAESIPAGHEQYLVRFDGLLERIGAYADPMPDAIGDVNFQTEPLAVAEQDGQALSLQFFIYKPRPKESTTNYEPSIMAKWFLGEGGLKIPQVIERYDYLSRQQFKPVLPGYSEEKIVGLLEKLEQDLASYEEARAKLSRRLVLKDLANIFLKVIRKNRA
ncbi:MAG: hypothetical protein ABSD10_03015 [Candidatus Saccharimonadales bacterium]|jgi:hypothetical protein